MLHFPWFPPVQGLIPDDFEARDLVAMIQPVLNAVPINYDFDVTDLCQTIG